MIKLVKVNNNNKNKLNRLMQLYLHEISSVFPIDFDSKKCIYIYDDLDKYINDSTKYAFLIKENECIKGFILADQDGSEMSIQEIFVLNNYKRNGIGEQAACTIFNKFKGNWTIKAVPKSIDAELFWKKTITDYTSGNYNMERIGKYNRAVFTFNNDN